MILSLEGLEDALLYVRHSSCGALPDTILHFGLGKLDSAPASLRRVIVVKIDWLPEEQRQDPQAWDLARYAQISVHHFSGRPGPPKRTTTRHVLHGRWADLDHSWTLSADADVLWQGLAHLQSLPVWDPWEATNTRSQGALM